MLKENTIDIQSVREFLSSEATFKDLDSDVISDIASHMTLLKFEAGEHLIWAGGLGQYLLVIKQGAIYVSLNSKDIELGGGAIIGEMALLSRKPSKADVVALEDSEAFAVNYDDFQGLMQKHASIATTMTELMKSRMFGANGLNSLSHYKIIEQFNGGCSADVYTAIDIDSGREVAIKMIDYEMASQPDFKESFHSNSKVITELMHPNIARVIEIIDDYSTEFIVMEKLNGCDLRYTMEQQGVFNEKQTRGVASKVALALEYASNKDNGDLIHQNVRLSNIVLDALGHVKLMGYRLPVNHKDMEAIHYMAPEMLQNLAVDYRADIYALGVTAFVMLTGKLPYSASTAEALIYEQNGSLSPDINSLVRDLPEGLAEFINRALIKEPDERISNWFEIQTLLASGKGSSLNLLANEKMDMALVIQLQTWDVDTAVLKQDIHKVMSGHHAQYEMEVVTRDNMDVDFSH